MKKYIVLLIFALAYSLQVPAHANPLLLDRATFVHASEEHKEKYIVALMELITELESRYQKETKTSGHSHERFMKYTQLMQKFTSLLISSAHAQDGNYNTDFTTYAEDFKKLLFQGEATKDKSCVYGAWISKMVGGFCTHPYNLSKTDDVFKAYFKLGKQCGTSTTAIACNPVIFGYESDKKPICVPSGPTSSANTSYECMRRSLAIDAKVKKLKGDAVLSEKEEKELAAAEVRMNYLKSQMEDKNNWESFRVVHETIFNTCLCGTSTSINEKYKHGREGRGGIVGHRTCFGLLNGVREMHAACTSLPPDTELSNLKLFFDSWTAMDFKEEKLVENKQYSRFETQQLDPSHDEKGTLFGEKFKDLLGQEKYQDYCKNLNDQLVCDTKCEPVKGTKNLKCTVISLKRGSTEFVENIQPLTKRERLITDMKQTEFPYWNTTCPVKRPEEEKPEACEILCEEKMEVDKASWTCEVKNFQKKDGKNLASLKEKDGHIIALDKAPGDKLEVDGVVCKVNIKGKKDNTCSITLTHDEKENSLKAQVKFTPETKDDKRKADWSVATGFIADAKEPNIAVLKDWDGKTIDFVMKLKGKKKDGKTDEEFECPGHMDGKDVQEFTCTLEQSSYDQNEKQLVVNITLTPNLKDGQVVSEVNWTPDIKKDADADPADSKLTGTFDTEAWAEPQVVSASVYIKKGNDLIAKDIKCSSSEKLPSNQTEDPNPNDDKPSISIKGGTQTDSNKQVIVDKITLNGETVSLSDLKGWSLIWKREGASDLTFKKEKKIEKTEEKDELKQAENQKDDAADDDKSTEATPNIQIPEGDILDAGGKVTTERKEHNYGVCAYLVNGTTEVKSNCVKIPRKDKAYTPSQTAPFQKIFRREINTWTGRQN